MHNHPQGTPTGSEDRRCRWFHLTPGHLGVALLSSALLLFLSERFQWFPFNHDRGRTVLIAVAGVPLAIVLILLWLIIALVFRLGFRFGMRPWLVLILGAAMPCGWLAWEARDASRVEEAAKAIAESGGHVSRDVSDERPRYGGSAGWLATTSSTASNSLASKVPA